MRWTAFVRFFTMQKFTTNRYVIHSKTERRLWKQKNNWRSTKPLRMSTNNLVEETESCEPLGNMESLALTTLTAASLNVSIRTPEMTKWGFSRQRIRLISDAPSVSLIIICEVFYRAEARNGHFWLITAWQYLVQTECFTPPRWCQWSCSFDKSRLEDESSGSSWVQPT